MNDIRERVERYYSGKFAEHGPSARGVDWSSPESQELRFRQLLRIAEGTESFSLVDYGCGYGALAEHLDHLGVDCRYAGYDLSTSMVEHARTAHPAHSFTTRREDLRPADYAVASGIFNVKQDVGEAEWRGYVLETIADLAALGTKGFAFNMLTSYSDADKMRDDLYYGDPCELFDHCKRSYSRNVALLHDYGLYEFTILVRA
ncbi:MAG: class I SAM-dependent methyltransferase [Gaiellaceae bacterium]